MKKILFIGFLCVSLCGCTMDETIEKLGFDKTNESTVTLDHNLYDSIIEGDSKKSIEDIVGTTCEIYYESGDAEEVWCRFWDKDDSDKKIVLKFENNILKSKSQSGL